MELRGSKEAQMMARSLVRTSAIIGVSAPAKTKKPKLCELSPKPLTQANPPPKKNPNLLLVTLPPSRGDWGVTWVYHMLNSRCLPNPGEGSRAPFQTLER